MGERVIRERKRERVRAEIEKKSVSVCFDILTKETGDNFVRTERVL